MPLTNLSLYYITNSDICVSQRFSHLTIIELLNLEGSLEYKSQLILPTLLIPVSV